MHEVVRLCIKKNQRTGNAQLTKAPQMHEALRLCMKNGRRSEEGVQPKCTKYCACASKTAQRTGNAQLTKTPQRHEAPRLCMKNSCGWIRVGSRWQHRLHEVLRLCIKNNPAHRKCTINKNIPNARSTAPVHEKWSGVG